MGPRAHGRILFWEGASLWVLSAPPEQPYPRTDFHSHHAVQVTLALTGRVTFDGDGEQQSGAALAIAPDARHAFQGTGLTAHLFVASEGYAGRQLVRQLFSSGPIAPVSPHRLGDLPARLRAAFEHRGRTDDMLQTLGRELVARLAGGAGQAQAPDPRVTKMIAWVAARLDQTLTLSDVAALVKLSPGRTRHLFVEQTGLSFRTYILWLRLMRAVEMFASGASLTEASHGAGFADSAHLSRTFRRMFGVAAVSLRVS